MIPLHCVLPQHPVTVKKEVKMLSTCSFMCVLKQNGLPSWNWGTFKTALYLLLAKDQQALWFDGMIWSQILSTPSLDAILESFPNAIPSGPGYADMMPLPIVYKERQLCDLE